jgi:hypothetical protein
MPCFVCALNNKVHDVVRVEMTEVPNFVASLSASKLPRFSLKAFDYEFASDLPQLYLLKCA